MSDARSPFLRASLALGLGLGLGLGCTGESSGPTLQVDLKTDALPGVEFTELLVEVEDADFGTLRFVDRVATRDLPGDLLRGAPLAELEGLAPRTYRVYAAALDDAGRVILDRAVEYELAPSGGALTVVLTRACRGVSCPRGLDGEVLACQNERCVDPACHPDAPEACGGDECATAADCGPAAACATPVCECGVCLYEVREASCAADERCHPIRGCEPDVDDCPRRLCETEEVCRIGLRACTPDAPCSSVAYAPEGTVCPGGRCDAMGNCVTGSGDECMEDMDCDAGRQCIDGFCLADGELRFTLRWDLPGDIDLHVLTPAGSEIYYANRDADGGMLDRDDTTGGPGTVENVVFMTPPPGRYHFFALNFDGDSLTPVEVQAFVEGELVAEIAETLPRRRRARTELAAICVGACEDACDDGMDDDGDGQTDCADLDCAFDDACRELCDVEGDEDGDGVADCMDADCALQAPCFEARCDDGMDDDGDDRVDCADEDCAGDFACGG